MKNFFLPLFVFCFSFSFSFAQNNSLRYENTSVVRLKYLSPEIETALDAYDVTYLSCRSHASVPEIIVSKDAIDWLSDRDIPYEVLVEDLKQKMDQENAYMDRMRDQRDGEDWYNVYRTYDEVRVKLEEIANSSEIASTFNVGFSFENRLIKGIKLSTGGADDKPAVFFNGCQHAREWITVMATTYLADKLVQNYLTNNYIQSLLSMVDVYIVPIVNPDGYVYTHDDNGDRFWRKNRQVNVGSPYVGTDLNRNWDANWNGGQSTSTSPSSDVYVGTAPFSATEANVLKNYMQSIPNLRGHLDIHSFSALVLGPWGYTNDQTPDHEEIVSLGNAMNTAITNTNNYPFTFGTGDANGSLYLASGTMPDWSYDSLGVLGFTYELRPNGGGLSGFDLDVSQIIDACEENYNGALEMILWASDASIQSGCMDPTACNYDPQSTVDDGSCAALDECGQCGGEGPEFGYDCEGNCVTGENLFIQMNDSFGDGWNGNTLVINGIAEITLDAGSSGSENICYDSSIGCIEVTCGGGSWQEEVSWTINYGSGELSGGAPFTGEFNCNEDIYGCTDSTAFNYEAAANTDDGSCIAVVNGCTDETAFNYEAAANTDDGSCILIPLPDSQTIALPSGWYMFSTYIDPYNPNMVELVSSIYESILIVKNGAGIAYLPTYDYNGIGDFLQGQGYLIKLNSASELVISGTKIVPEDVTLSFNSGWNLFGYLRDSSADIVETVMPINDHIIIIKNYAGLAYLPTFNYNGIGNMEPGQGYLMKLDTAVDFTYPGN